MFKIRMRQFIWALSSTADLVGVTDILHGKRVAFYADQISRHLPSNFPWSRNDIISAALLHDCGVSSTDVHERLVREMEWARASEHCTRGADLLNSSSLLQNLAAPVRLHHTRWSLFDASYKVAKEAQLGNLIFLADRLDVMIANQTEEILISKDRVLEKLEGYSGLLFNPDFIQALGIAAQADIFWIVRDASHLQRHFEDWLNHDEVFEITAPELTHLFGLFGKIVDAKSRFTGEHSKAVAELCFEIGRKAGLEDQVCYRLGLAGLVHDIGKLRIPDAILNKDRDLNETEFSTIRHHSFDALDVLSQLGGFEDVARLSSMHHERLDGSGYPYQLEAKELPIEARILAVADIFQALVQKRPYRKEMHDDQIKSILTLEASRGKIDANIVATVLDHFNDLLVIAQQRNRLN